MLALRTTTPLKVHRTHEALSALAVNMRSGAEDKIRRAKYEVPYNLHYRTLAKARTNVSAEDRIRTYVGLSAARFTVSYV